jgi:iron complex outermembrane receptor protein
MEPAGQTVTAATGGASAEDAFNFFLQEAQVVTASRRAQKKSDSPVAIDVITREEIESSGAQTVYDLLRFRVGVDVIEGNSFEGNPVLLNVRGLPEEFAQSLQVLVDGRSIVSGTNSGVYWRRLPVSLDDIERIEIVRGPNSALFGANAGQGVINILTRKPGAGGQFRAEAGSLQRFKGHLTLDGQASSVDLRASVDETRMNSAYTPQGDPAPSGNPLEGDLKMNLRAVAQPWTGGELDLSAGRDEIKYSYPIAFGLAGNTGVSSNFVMLRLNHALNEDLGLEFMTARREELSSAYFEGGHETAYDGDLLARLSLLEGKSQTVLGTSVRYIQDDFVDLFSNATSGPAVYAYTRSSAETTGINHQQRAYLSEQVSLAEWLSLALAASYEGSDTGGEQPAYQGALIFKPSPSLNLRLSGSKSPTMPSMTNKYGRIELQTGFIPPATVTVARVEGTSMYPPQVASYEATLNWSPFERIVEMELTGYQMEISGYPEFIAGPAVNFPFPVFIPGKTGTLSYYRNTYDMVLRGAETTLTWKPAVGSRVQLNHTYEDVAINVPSRRYQYATPWNKVNLFGSTELPWHFNLSGGISWSGEHIAYLASKAASLAVPDQAKVDLRLGYHPHKDVEIYAQGLNLDHQFRTEAPDGITATQTYAGGVDISWGGSPR